MEKGLDATGQRFKWPQGLGGSNCYPAWAEKGVQHPNPRPGLKLPLCQTPCVTLIPPLPDPCNGDETHVLRGGGGDPLTASCPFTAFFLGPTQVLDNLDSHLRRSEYFRFLWFPHSENVSVIYQDHTNKVQPSPLQP